MSPIDPSIELSSVYPAHIISQHRTTRWQAHAPPCILGAMTLALCIVGCGSYARSVLDDIHDMTEDILLFYASRDIEKAKSYLDTFGGAGCFGSYEEAAGDPRVEALYFLTPHDLHLENALLATRHRKHILVEKPIARTISEGRQMVRAAGDAGVTLMVAENYRFLPTVEECKRLLEQRAIGELRLIQVQSEAYAETSGWRTSAAITGGRCSLAYPSL